MSLWIVITKDYYRTNEETVIAGIYETKNEALKRKDEVLYDHDEVYIFEAKLGDNDIFIPTEYHVL